MRLVRIALANVNTTVGAVLGNVERAIRRAREADAEGANLVVFPEQLVGGYAQEDLVQWVAFVKAQYAGLLRFAAETRDLGCAMALGVTAGGGGVLYNCAALVYRGRVLGLVPKEKLPAYNVFYESRTLAKGTAGLLSDWNGVPLGDLLFRFPFGTVALEVCEDLWSPDGPTRRRAFAGADLVLNLSASPFRIGFPDTRRETIATRSFDNAVTVAYANLVGSNDGLIFDGGGYVAQNGRVLFESTRYREHVAAFTVDLARTERLRAENTTWRADREAFLERGGPSPKVIEVEYGAVERDLVYPVPTSGSLFLPDDTPVRSSRETFCEDLLDALALGIGDYFEKVGAFRQIGVALSGGRDSLLCLLLARRYVERICEREGEGVSVADKSRELLRAFFMPTRFTSAETTRAAEVTASELGVPLSVVSIDDAFARELEATRRMLQPGEALSPLAVQNVQTRIRAERMWTWSNSCAGLFLQTSNMSEKAVGYVTVGGDLEGALSVIANVPKTVVVYLLEYLLEKTNSEAIRLTTAVPASAELAENMEDERDLMPFPILDACFGLYVGERMSIEDVQVALHSMFPSYPKGSLDAWAVKFRKLFGASIYKWAQAPIGLHIGHLDLDRERALQLPVVHKAEW